MKNLLTFLFIALISVSCSEKKPTHDDIEKIVEEYTSKNQLNGSIIIAKKNSIIYQESFGLANIETNTKITSSTVFPIASVSKQFTATAIMLLQEKGTLSIDDKISNYLEAPLYMENVTIKNLLNHTSGILDYWPNNIENNSDSIYAFLYKQDSLQFTPNTNQSYSNSGYFLLGKIIEKVSGKSYSEFMNSNIFEPLGMNSTLVYDKKFIERAIGYDISWNKNEYLATTADGGILSTIDDLFLWDKALSENILLSKENKIKMFEPVTLNNEKTIKYGFGWNIGFDKLSLFEHLLGKGENVVSHTGGLSGFGAYNQYDTKDDLYVILLSNQLRPELMNLINDINKALY